MQFVLIIWVIFQKKFDFISRKILNYLKWIENPNDPYRSRNNTE